MPTKKTKEKDTEQQPVVKEVKIMMTEQGTSGLKEGQGFVQEAYNQALYWPQVQPMYHRLRTSMPEIVAIRQAFTAWARRVSPIVELPDKPTDDDKKFQDFLLSDFENMEGGFGSLLDTMVNHVPFNGWGWWEAVPSRRLVDWKPPDKDDEWRSEEDDGLIGIRRLAWRDASTFNGWDLTEKKVLRGMKQRDYPHPEVTLPLKNSLHVTYGGGNNPEGNTPLQAVWRLERIKFGLEVIQGIGFEHAAGYLDVEKTEKGDLSDQAKQLVKQAASAILTAQEGNYALWPYGMKGQVKDINFSAASSILEAIKYYGILTLSVYVMQWIALNTMTGTGSFASADSSTDMGIGAYNGMMDGFAQQYSDQIGRRLYQWNKDAFPNMTKRPKIKFSHLEKNIALETLGAFWSQINGIIPLSEDDYKAFRERTGFMPKNLPEKDLSVTTNQLEEETEDNNEQVDAKDEAVPVKVMRNLAQELKRSNDLIQQGRFE